VVASIVTLPLTVTSYGRPSWSLVAPFGKVFDL
jgi:hypothetical protein